jgi:hypothetical protein
MLLLIFQLKLQANKSYKLQIMQEETHDQLIRDFLNCLYQQKYKTADSLLNRGFNGNEPGYLYFKGLLFCTVFNDYGDTSSLNHSKHYWEKLKESIEKEGNISNKKSSVPLALYHGLTLMQISYISSVKYHFFNSILQARSGIKILKRQNHFLEAQCAVQIYEYYKNDLLKSLNWLPFFEVDKTKQRRFLEQNYSRSRYLAIIFLTPLIWMQFDEGKYQKGLDFTRSFLNKFPENRIYRLMEADFYYKMKKYAQSAEIFEDIKSEYLKIYSELNKKKCIKINYYCAAGNLVRVYDAMRNQEGKNRNAAIWFSDECDKVRKWLPASLVKDLKRYKRNYEQSNDD